MDIHLEPRTDGSVDITYGPNASLGRRVTAHSLLSSTAIDRLRAILTGFFGRYEAGSPSRITIVPGQHAAYRRRSPRAAFEFYDSRMSAEDMLRPLFLPPDDFAALRPFQAIGARWLIDTKRVILADDMGLGKTVQAIFALRSLIRAGIAQQAIVVCPGILVPNWTRELSRWAPELGVCVMRPPNRSRTEAWRLMKGRMHVLLTTYDHARVAATELRDYSPDVLVVDEAHRLRNPRSLTTLAIGRINSSLFWALTGTPIERHGEDLISLLSLVAPGRVGRSVGSLGSVVIRTLARPYLLRRLKRDVLHELPSSDEQNVWLDLTREQRMAYEAATLERGRNSALATIATLRKICDMDPISGQSAKLDYLIARSQEIVDGLAEKAVVFSLTLPPLIVCARRLADVGIKAFLLTGRVSRDGRESLLDAFRTGGPSILLASAKLASEGLTLTEANHVFFLNLWWNPSANDQARDRVLRIGQNKHVNVRNLLCADTLDEELYQIVMSKQQVYSSITQMLANTTFRISRP